MPLLPATAEACLRLVAGRQVEARLPSLVGGVARGGGLAWFGARGATAFGPDAVPGAEPTADPAPGAEPTPGPEPTPDTQYRMGSITKTFTALLVLQLRDEGRLDLDDPLERHLPGTAVGGLRISGLLSHLAGIGREPAGPWWERNPGTDAETLVAGVDGPALRPDRAFHYSNLAYGLLGEVVARLRGVPWWQALTERILGPLGLTRTTYDPVPPAATGYSVHPWCDAVVAEPTPDTVAMAPAGQLWTTAADLARYATFLADPDEAVIAKDTLDEACHPRALWEPPGAWGLAYGLGFGVWRQGDRVLVGHAGSMPGFLAGLAVDRAAGVGGITLANAYSGYAPVALASELVTTVLDAEPPLPPPWRPGPPPDKAVAALLGAWFWGYVEMAVTAAGTPGTLVLRSSKGDDEATFVADGTDRWRGVDGEHLGETLTVVRGPDGTVDHLNLSTYRLARTPYGVM